MCQGRSRKLFLLLVVVAILMGGASLLLEIERPGPGSSQSPVGSPTEPPAVMLLPELSGYYVVEGESLTDYIGTLGGGAALLAGQPELAAAVVVVDEIAGCYQEVGAVQVQVYADQAEPLSAGAVAIADRNAMLDPANLFECVAPAIPDASGVGASSVEIEPCTASYTLGRDGNEFYIVYAGTTEAICQAFCAALEGCTAHP